MQSTSADLGMVCNLYKSLKDYVQTLREIYDYYEQKGMELIKSEVANYEEDTKKRRNRNRMSDEDELNDTDNDTNKLNDEEIRQKACGLVDKYSSDLTSELGEELIHFKAFVEEAEGIEENAKEHHLPAYYLKFIREKQLTTLFPKIDTALKILLCMMSSNASGEP
ncbi:hypothetical protein J6590_087713 [Homalodisca vitripennis]|nr:hypothetical protein J6590_087713 [Homalodisca vitripennis]